MKKISFLLLLSLFFAFNSFAGGVVRKAPENPLTSIIYKEFQTDDLSGEVFEHYLVLKTYPSDEGIEHQYSLHKKLLETWENNGWRAYYLPPDYGMYYDVPNEEFVIILQFQAFNDLRRHRNHYFEKIVEYYNPIKADVEIFFERGSENLFYALIPEFDPDPNFHTFKFRGKDIDDFLQNVFEKLEEEIRRNNNYIDVNPTQRGKKHKRNF